MTLYRSINSWPGADGNTLRGHDFTARWAGFIKATAAAYTFQTGLGGVEERARLWIDSKLVIDQWTSLSSTNPVGTYTFATTNHYDLKLEHLF